MKKIKKKMTDAQLQIAIDEYNSTIHLPNMRCLNPIKIHENKKCYSRKNRREGKKQINKKDL